MSLPSVMAANPAPTAAALPPDEPPGTREIPSILVEPNALVSVEEPNANSSMLSLPSGIPPASMVR